MNKKISLGFSISITILAMLLTFLSTIQIFKIKFNNQLQDISQKQALFGKLSEVDSNVRNSYLFSKDMDEKVLADSALKGYVSGLGDKYASYFTKEEYEEQVNHNDGKYEGIGIVVSPKSDELIIESIVNGSPAKSAGVKAGDKIISIDDKKVSQLGTDEATTLLKTNKKSKLLFERKGQNLSITLERKKYDLISVTYEIYKEIGVIRISEFNSETVSQFTECMESLQSDKVKGYVFDLRDNPGGTLDSVCAILDKLVGKGELVTATYSDGSTENLYMSNPEEIKGKMVVLVNENTASAAELFAAVMRDYNKGKIVGVTTYGKGVMQTMGKLSDGSVIKMTTSYFNPPKSKNFNGKGVEPDVVAELPNKDAKISELNLEEDLQFQTAITVIESMK